MLVSQLMRGMLGEPQPDQAKALELRIGQVVRGVVLQLLDGQEALVSLAGVQVRARLETPLAPGQSAMLQVMPESSAGTIVLRQADAGNAQSSEATLRELMRTLGLPDKRWAAELALDLRRGGYPVTRETGEALKQVAAARPADVPEAEWMQAAATAWKRGLPVTESTVAALRQAMFGKPLGELLASLRGQLAAFALQGSAAGGAAGPDTAGTLPALAARVLALLAEGEALLAGPAARAGGPANPAGAAPAGGATGSPAAPGAAGAGASVPAGQAQAGQVPAGQMPPGPAPQGGGAPGGVPAGAGAASGAGQPPAASGSAGPAAGGARQASARAVDAQPQGAAAGGAQTAGGAGQTQQAAAPQSGNWIHGLLKWLGVDYEKQLSQLTGARGEAAGGRQDAAPRTAGDAPSGAAAAGRDAAAGPGPGAGLTGTAERMAPQIGRGVVPFLPHTAEQQPAPAGGAGETLKQALLSLAAADDAPAALRETAQQLVQQITGQQLLLAPEKNGALFSHMTLFIPFQGEDGGTTAQITIQSRRGRKGELDPDNCRLLFDLRMKHLGDTVVDVQVVDRFVSLNLWNDHPAVSRLVESARDEAAEALRRAGYQLSSMRVKPFPDTASRNAAKESAAAAPLPTPAVYAGKPYRGVDYRA
ncbi:Flagellar hook-length control protein FliK [Thermobacillus composti KWC4]|uniref:Flagellar hook-length control protein FliK n=2 Tax=Thermobacillus TaxID=76632 RepID=L0ED90_THECK|nr:Flagellar hook-length control protein FliK [Thermobacillus composti KWC4]